MIQLIQLHPTENLIESSPDKYVFDNDTVRITYTFWSHHGQFGFSIENKLSTPIYVDWKKSNLIYNGTPNVYWTDETVVNSNSVTRGIAVRGHFGVSMGMARTDGESIIRPKERVTFLPPTSTIERNEYAIENSSYYLMDLTKNGEVVTNDANPKKMTTVYKQGFTDVSSPIHLTNFLTISSKENFEVEWFIQNSFYINEIEEMELAHFRGKCTGSTDIGEPICPRVLRSNKKYYLYVPKGYDFVKRKKRKMTKYVSPYTGLY